MPISNVSPTLLTAAEAYTALGWSVIPLLGDLDPARPKVPSVPWSEFQRRHASLEEQCQWSQMGGLGIVTGQVSGLVVLDFDSNSAMDKFKVWFPDLLETRTVLSAGRQLPHLYFHLPSHLHLASRKGQGVDLLSDGCYVVAPPTSINGQAYKIIRGGMPKTLTDLGRLQAFCDSLSMEGSCTSRNTLKNPFRTVLSYKEPHKPSLVDLVSLYHHHCQTIGRNQALFKTSLYARDTGWLLKDAQQILVALHSQQLARSTHHKETTAQRLREAVATILSAFSKPARPLQAARQQGYVSNSVREVLMQHKMTYVIRTYEGLLLAGIKPGQLISVKAALEKLKGVVGRGSVLKALKAGQGQQRFFSPVNPHHAVATDNSLTESKKCFFEGSKNRQKVKMGRPEQVYRMPTNDELCAVLGVKATGSDVLEQADLASAPKTRMALHRELIKRRPGSYPRRWLAQRLGVNTRTIAAYNRLIPIHSRLMFTETPITWKNIERLPFDEPIQGAVLVTFKGKRYPALRTIASRLLARGEGIRLKQQTANFYWYGETEPLLTRLEIQQAVEIEQERIEAFVTQQPTIHSAMEFRPPALKAVTKKKTLPKNLHRPLKNAAHEAQAQHLYQTMSQISPKRLSLANARRLVANYEVQAVTDVLTLLKSRQTVTNPVGFLVTLLRLAGTSLHTT